jgi:hypothetical protein
MNPCKVTTEVFGETAEFEVSSHLAGIYCVDIFVGSEQTVRHYQGSSVLSYGGDVANCDAAFAATFGKYLEDGSVDHGTWLTFDMGA